MKGYWFNLGGASSSPTPPSIGQDTIGLPTCMVGNDVSTSLSINSNSNIDVSKLTWSTPKLLPNYPAPYIRSTMYYQTADFTPKQYIPTAWYGYTTVWSSVFGENGIKTYFLPTSNDIITSCKAYTFKCKIIRMYESMTSTTVESIDALIKDLQDYKNYYNINFGENKDLLNLPIFTGTVGLPPSSGGSVTIKQNRHYSSTGGGSVVNNININGKFLPRRWIRNIDTWSLDWTDTGDVSTSPVGSFIYSPYKIVSSSAVRTDVLNNKIPYSFNLSGDGGIQWHSSTESSTYNFKYFNLNDFKNGGDLINTDNYGYRGAGQYNDSGIFIPDSKKYTQLPYIAPNNIYYFGDGKGLLDSTLVDTYTYNGNSFHYTDPLRYAYVETVNVNVTSRYRVRYVYWVITYLDNDIQELTTDTTKPNEIWYGHLENNTWNN